VTSPTWQTFVGPTQAQIIELLSTSGPLTAREVQTRLRPDFKGRSTSWAAPRLGRLVQKGKLVRIRFLDRKGRKTGRNAEFRVLMASEPAEQWVWPEKPKE